MFYSVGFRGQLHYHIWERRVLCSRNRKGSCVCQSKRELLVILRSHLTSILKERENSCIVLYCFIIKYSWNYNGYDTVMVPKMYYITT
jgi:hypothetical protein